MALRLDGPRRTLRDLPLTGNRLVIRRFVFGLAMASGAIALVALPFARHEAWVYRTDVRGEHHLLTETMYVPLAIVLALELALWWAARGRLLRAVVMSLLVSGVALFTMAGMVVQHILASTRGNLAETASYLGLFGVFVMGGVIFVAEWILVVGERRRLECGDPVFPTARVVR